MKSTRQKGKRKKRCDYHAWIDYGDGGFFKAGIVKNNKPKVYDVIRLWIRKYRKVNKTGVSINEMKFDFTVNEAMSVIFILQKALTIYGFKHDDQIKNWERLHEKH